MQRILLVGLGGAFGAIARFKLGGLVLHHSPERPFLGTFVVNVVGCLIAGLLAGFVERQDWFSADTRVFLFTGVLGGFTTFSAFGVDAVTLFRRGDGAIAFAYILLTVLCGFVALWLAMLAAPHRAA